MQDFNLDRLLRFVVEKGASDVHLHAGRRPLVRIRGGLVPLNMEALEGNTVERVARSIMSDQQEQQFTEQLAVDLGYTPKGLEARFRVSAYHQRGTAALSMRYISRMLPTVSSLGLPQAIRMITGRSQGMVLVTGPTGAGKSTTLAA